MINKNMLIKKIIYRSSHRGTKEMDLLLGKFVNKYVYTFNKYELNDLNLLLNIDDEILYKWYLNQASESSVPINRVSKKLKKFKL